jgi:aminoglycoside 6'-N-acetyltransferase
MRRDDLPTMARWVGEPHVARWGFGPDDAEALAVDYGPFLDGEDRRVSHFIIEDDGIAVGFIQHYRIRDFPPWLAEVDLPDAAGIDYLIGDPDRIGKGIGSEAIRRFAMFTFETMPDVPSIAVAPQQANVASWRALEKAGFTRIYAGLLESDDPSDAGPAFVYELRRDQASSPLP